MDMLDKFSYRPAFVADCALSTAAHVPKASHVTWDLDNTNIQLYISIRNNLWIITKRLTLISLAYVRIASWYRDIL